MRARRLMDKMGLVKEHDGKHVDHVKSIKSGGSNAKSNLKAISAKANLRKEAQRKKRNANK